MAIAGISHVGLTVSDLNVSREWYSAVLDWTPLQDGATATTAFVYGQLPDGTVLVLRRHSESAAPAFDERAPGLDHLSFGCTRADLDDVERRLAQRGARFTPTEETDYALVLNFRDPDGIALELTAPRG